MKFSLQENLNLFQFSNLDIKTLVVESKYLKGNPLGDSTKRSNPILCPKNIPLPLPVVFILAGFTGNGGKYFNQQSFKEGSVEILANAITKKQAPKAIYVFVDALTFWGGSQFINSKGSGKYEDYIIKELVSAVSETFQTRKEAQFWAVTGGSSGGYGAIHLASKYPHVFGNCAAIAPDCFFNLSLLPEIYSAWPYIQKWGGVIGVKKALKDGKIWGRKEAHNIINAIGMGICYSPKGKEDVHWPINDYGELNTKVWQKWLKHDPLVFLQKRKNQLNNLKNVYLDVGAFDQFHLQYGSRQLLKIFKKNHIHVTYSEFQGNHFDISDRKVFLWKWLNDIFSKCK